MKIDLHESKTPWKLHGFDAIFRDWRFLFAQDQITTKQIRLLISFHAPLSPICHIFTGNHKIVVEPLDSSAMLWCGMHLISVWVVL